MTHASHAEPSRHDTLAVVTGRSGRGTARQTIRVEEALWNRFGVVATNQDTDRSALLREFIAWYLRVPGTKLPKRPDTVEAE